MNEFELIEDYLKGKLQGQALLDFEDKLAINSNFASKVEEHKAMQDMIFMKGLLETRDKLQAIRKAKSTRNSSNNEWLKGIGLSFLAIILITSSYLFFNKEKISENSTTESATVSKENKQIEKVIEPQKQEVINIPGIKNKIYENKIETQKNESVITDSIPDNSIKPIISDTHTIKHKDPKSIVEQTTIPASQEISCAAVVIKAKVHMEESCQDKATGKIILSQLTGGKAPYRFSLNDSESFVLNSYFDYLEAGKYKIHIIDANGCKTILESNIVSKPCQSNIFAPDNGETWKFPISSGGNCKIRIYDVNGTMIYEVATINGNPSEWNGAGSHGGYVKAGAYLYQINCDDGIINQGSVTVSK